MMKKMQSSSISAYELVKVYSSEDHSYVFFGEEP